MLINPTEAEKQNYITEQFCNSKKALIEKYNNFTNRLFGIEKGIPVLQVLGPNADDYTKALVATMCENFVRNATQQMQESSTADLPHWVKRGLAMIAASYAEDLTGLLISEQPLGGKRGRIHYLDIKSENSKGKIPAGTRLFDALRGFIGTDEFSGEKIIDEPLGAAGGTDYSGTCVYLPVIPGSVEITDGNLIIRDDRNGNLVGDVGTPGGGYTNTINYITGAVSLKFNATTTGPVVMNYTYNIEAADNLPKYGIAIRSTDVEARERAISAEWSHQFAVEVQEDWGVDAEPTILDAGAKILQAESFKHVSKHLYQSASGGSMIFDNTQPPGISYREHIDAFGIMVSRLMHELWRNTEKVRPNVCAHAPDIWFLFQYTKGFQSEGSPHQTDALAGPKKSGVLSEHQITCIADPSFYPGKAVLSYKGGDPLSTAAIKATHIPIYRGPIHAKYFKKDVAMLTSYVLHNINAQMMGRIEVTNL